MLAFHVSIYLRAPELMLRSRSGAHFRRSPYSHRRKSYILAVVKFASIHLIFPSFVRINAYLRKFKTKMEILTTTAAASGSDLAVARRGGGGGRSQHVWRHPERSVLDGNSRRAKQNNVNKTQTLLTTKVVVLKQLI